MLRSIFILFLSVFLSNHASAANDKDQIVRLLHEAYGADHLNELRSVSIKSDRRLAYPGTNYSDEFNEFVLDRNHFQLDLRKLKGSAERYVIQNGNIFHDRSVTTDDGLAQISYPLNRISIEPDYDFYEQFGSAFRITDTLLAFVIVRYPERVEVLNPSRYRDSPLYNVGLRLPGAEQTLRISIAADTGRIMRLTRQAGVGELTYLFRDHMWEDGILYAGESQVYLNGALFDYEMNRRMIVNRVDESAFEVSKQLDHHQEPARTELKVHEISDRVHHIGAGITYSTFIQADGYVIAAGASSGFAERYALYQEEVEEAGPLRYLIISHDHEMRRNGHQDAVALGARLVIAESISHLADDHFNDEAQSVVEPVKSGFSLGPVQFFELETAHTSSMLVTYIAEEKILVEEDHYRPVFEGVPAHLYGATKSLVSSVSDLDLDIEYLLSGHGAKLERWDVLRDASADRNETCWMERDICSPVW